MNQARRLVAILAADLVGYSRLIGSDEEGTLERPQSAAARSSRSVSRSITGEVSLRLAQAG
jgi:hypothetical protein